MLRQNCNSETLYRASSGQAREDHPIFLVINAVLAAHKTVRRWLDRRRTRLALADLDEHLLRDIGVTPVEARRESGRWWPGRDKSRRALAELDDSQLSNLSEIGRQAWREARRSMESRNTRAGGVPGNL
jgi:uncharacterized protein YjiS (DUF1127 family)